MKAKLIFKVGEIGRLQQTLGSLIGVLGPEQMLEVSVNAGRIPSMADEEFLRSKGLDMLYSELNASVEALELSVRVTRFLREANIRYVGELVQLTEASFMKLRNSHRRFLREIKEVLEPMGFSLGMNVFGWTVSNPRSL